MKKIEKKYWQKYFGVTSVDKKKYGVRLNNFDTEEGDLLSTLNERNLEIERYTGRYIEKRIARISMFNIYQLFKILLGQEIKERVI